MQVFKNAEKIVFSSEIKAWDDIYEFSIEVVPKGKSVGDNGNAQLSKPISVTKFYDTAGHQHRYILKEFITSALAGLNEFSNKKSK